MFQMPMSSPQRITMFGFFVAMCGLLVVRFGRLSRHAWRDGGGRGSSKAGGQVEELRLGDHPVPWHFGPMGRRDASAAESAVTETQRAERLP